MAIIFGPKPILKFDSGNRDPERQPPKVSWFAVARIVHKSRIADARTRCRLRHTSNRNANAYVSGEARRANIYLFESRGSVFSSPDYLGDAIVLTVEITPIQRTPAKLLSIRLTYA